MEMSNFTNIKISEVMPEPWIKLAVGAYNRFIKANEIRRSFNHIYFNLCPNKKNCRFSRLGGCNLGRCIHSFPTEEEAWETFK